MLVAVRTCLKDLEELLSEPDTLNGMPTYTSQLDDHISQNEGKYYLKNNHLLRGKTNINSTRRNFLDELIANIKCRFPEDSRNLLAALGALGMRPIDFLSGNDLHTWGDEQLEVLIEQFEKQKQAPPKKKYQEDTVHVVAPPIIDEVATREEWRQIKPLVVNEGYPRDHLATLWGLILKFHKCSFPNLAKTCCNRPCESYSYI